MTDRERYDAILTALNQVSYEHTVHEHRITWQGPVKAVLGEDPEELGSSEDSWLDRVHPDDLDAVQQEFDRAQREDQLFDHEYRFRHHSGEYIWIHDRGKMILDDEGQVTIVLGVVRDITEQRQATESLRRAESLHRSIAEHFPRGGIFLYDRDIRIIYAEGRGLKTYGLDKDKLIGHRLTDFFDSPQLAEFGSLIQLAFHGKSSTIEIPFQGTHYIVYITPFRENGDISAAMVVTYDISQRVQTERELANSERRYRTLAENSLDAIILLTPDGTVEYLNSRGHSFFPTVEGGVIGRNIKELFPPDAYARMIDSVRTVVKTGDHLHYETRYPFPTGELWLNSNLSPIKEGDRVTGVMIVSRDLTAQKEAEALRQRQREQEKQIEAIGTMVVTVAHEFRNPLAILLNSANLLQQQDYNEETRGELTAKIVKNVRRLNDLVENLVQLRHLEETDYTHGLRMYSLKDNGETKDGSGE